MEKREMKYSSVTRTSAGKTKHSASLSFTKSSTNVVFVFFVEDEESLYDFLQFLREKKKRV